MTKTELRRTLRALERELPETYLRESGAEICARVLAMPEYEKARCIFCFVGTGREVDTAPILRAALAAGKRVCVPLCTSPGVMELRLLQTVERLSPGAYGIPEPPADSPEVDPDEVELAVVPCVSCSSRGARLGRGGGYYDRFLARYGGISAVLCRDRLLREDIPEEGHDRRVGIVVTETNILRITEE